MYLGHISENLHFVVDCQWNDWDIGECSVSCGGGRKRITRSKQVVEKYGGSSCAGNSTKEENCNEHHCPGMNYDAIVLSLLLGVDNACATLY